MDSVFAKELREKIERAKLAEKDNLQFLHRERQKQVGTAQCNGADQDSLDAIGHAYDDSEARIRAQTNEIVANWQRELDALGQT